MAEQLHEAGGKPAAQLHQHALQAEKHLEALATGLGQTGADPQAVKAVGQMADVMRQLLGQMAKQAQAETPPAPRPTMESATNEMMAEKQAATA